MESIDVTRQEVLKSFNKAPQKVQDLTRRFFKSMDINDDELVDFQEIDSFFKDRNFRIPHQILKKLDQDDNQALDFEEFVAFFYMVFLLAKCGECSKSLSIKERRTCRECYGSAPNNCALYDICRTCYRLTHRNSHHHSRSNLIKFEKLIFNGLPGQGGTNEISGNDNDKADGKECRRQYFIDMMKSIFGVTGFLAMLVSSCNDM